MNQPTVAHLTTVDLSLRYLLLNQMQAIQQAGYDVVGLSALGPDVPVLEEAGVRHMRVPFVRASGLTPFADFRAFIHLLRLFRRHRFSIVHTHTAKPDLFGTIAARLAGVPVVITTLHGFYFHEHMKPSWRRFYMALAKIGGHFADVILSQNPEDLETNRQAGIYPTSKMRFLGNGIDIDRFDRRRLDAAVVRQKRLELGLPKDTLVVGFVGRLVRDKGILDLLQAAVYLRQRVPGIRLLIVGPEDRVKADALAADVAHEYDLGDICVFAGQRLDMPEMYGIMDLFVLPSYREAFPRSVMEASAMGLPVVATDVRGCRTAVDAGRTGLLVPLGDVAALAETITSLLKNPEERRKMGAAGRAVAEERFDERKVFATVVNEYGRLLAAKELSGPVTQLQERS